MVEEIGSIKNDTLKVYVDRLMLRLYAYPSLLGYLIGVRDDGRNTFELEFFDIPDDVLVKVPKLFGDNVSYKVFRYNKNNSKRAGYKVTVPDVHRDTQSKNA